jgi:hypothetical protein
MDRQITKRNVALVYVFSMITFGVYWLYWLVSTKRDMNAIGGEIPTSFLLLVPVANLWWVYKYAEAYATHVKKDSNSIVYFALFAFVGFLTPMFVQSGLNHVSTKSVGKQSFPQAA